MFSGRWDERLCLWVAALDVDSKPQVIKAELGVPGWDPPNERVTDSLGGSAMAVDDADFLKRSALAVDLKLQVVKVILGVGVHPQTLQSDHVVNSRSTEQR